MQMSIFPCRGAFRAPVSQHRNSRADNIRPYNLKFIATGDTTITHYELKKAPRRELFALFFEECHEVVRAACREVSVVREDS